MSPLSLPSRRPTPAPRPGAPHLKQQHRNIAVGMGTPLGLRVGSRLTPGNEVSQETHMPTRQEASFGRGARGGRRTAPPCGVQARA